MSDGTTDDQNVEEPEGDEPAGGEPAADEPKGEPAADEPKLDAKTQKRIDDLISARDKEVARANKAESALKAAGKGAEPGSNDPAQSALLQELREASLDAVYGDFPELKKFGIERSLIEGSTRAEMRESATTIVALVKNVVTKARNEVLEEHGIKAEPTGSTRSKPQDYASLSDEDFDKLLNSIS